MFGVDVEPILAGIGKFILAILVFGVLAIILLVLLKGIIKLAIRPRSHFLRLFFQIIPASLEFTLIAGLGSMYWRSD